MNKKQRRELIRNYATTGSAHLEHSEILDKIEQHFTVSDPTLVIEVTARDNGLELLTGHGNIYLLQLLNITGSEYYT